MRKFIYAIAIAAAATGTAAQAAITFNSTYQINANYSDPGLMVRVDTNAGAPGDQHSGALSFALNNVGDTYTMTLFNIFANETDVDTVGCGSGQGDQCPKPISAAFAFTQPNALLGSVNGSTAGERILAGLFQDGNLTWADPDGTGPLGAGEASLAFNGSVLKVALSSTTFGSGMFGLNQRASAPVSATFTLTAVPEPATWAMMLLGFGAVGTALRRRRTPISVLA